MYNLEQIKEVLPHRDPFLFIDEIIEMSHEERTISAKKFFSKDLDFFKGHFPNQPITPGVVILEAMAQTGAFLVLSHETYKGKIALFAGADEVKWRNVVLPDDEVIFKLTIKNFRHGVGIAKAYAYVDDKIACEALIKVVVK